MTNATVEIILIVGISMLLGAALRWLYEQIMFDDVYDLEEAYPSYLQDKEMEPERVENTPDPLRGSAPAHIPTAHPVVMPYMQDDLKIIEGVGPKIEQLLHEGGITTWQELADTPAEHISELLRNAGERYRIHDPTTWPEQGMLAAEHRWAELEEFQDSLSGGKDLTRIYGNKSG